MENTSLLSLIHGPTDMPLWHKTIGSLMHEQAQRYGDSTAVSVPWQKFRCTYGDMERNSEVTSRALLTRGVKHGDMVAIMAGNRYEYLDFVLAAARIGCPLVVLNNTYTPKELLSALSRTAAKILLMADTIGSRSLSKHLTGVSDSIAAGGLSHLRSIILLPQDRTDRSSTYIQTYMDFLQGAKDTPLHELRKVERLVRDDDVVNVQFTSGTTGLPKAALLTHKNILNNGRFVGDRMHLTHRDVICCPPPLFHCFGLVMGFLNSLSHGATLVLPSDAFDAGSTLDAIVSEGCTALLGVPTMLSVELEKLQHKKLAIKTLRVGLASGAPVPLSLQKRLLNDMGIKDVLIAYGMTEVSPVSTMMDISDTEERKKGGLGTVMPHNSIKIIDSEGQILPRGSRGEICSSGYALMKGYLNNQKATNEAMRRDGNGVLWMHTGDEGLIDEGGYLQITGRIKDMIIRGGENIFPAEVEERLLEHPNVAEVSVVGLPDERYGEVVASFIRTLVTEPHLSDGEVKSWVGERLGRHKVPVWVYRIGPGGVADDFPKTGSGKHQKHLLRALGKDLLGAARSELLKARL